jgi:tripartite tricarboxylate transporter TctB family protein
MSDPNATESPSRTGKSKGELVFDIVLVLAIGGYLLVAQGYPAIGRQIPTVVGIVALVAAVVQLVGWFVPGMWRFTHGDPRDDDPTRNARQAVSGIAGTRSGEARPPEQGTGGKPLDVPIAMAWAGGFLVAILLFGYLVAVPLFFLVYFGVRRAWVLAIASAVVMGVVTSVLFATVLDIPLYAGVLF